MPWKFARRRSATCLLLMMLSSTTGCALLETGVPANANADCLAYAPIYLDEADITALSRDARRQIATHNRTYETRCPSAA